MSALFDELKKQSCLLTEREKAMLARILIKGLDGPTVGNVEQVWVSEAQRRYESYLRGKVESHPGDEVMTRARSRLK